MKTQCQHMLTFQICDRGSLELKNRIINRNRSKFYKRVKKKN